MYHGPLHEIKEELIPMETIHTRAVLELFYIIRRNAGDPRFLPRLLTRAIVLEKVLRRKGGAA